MRQLKKNSPARCELYDDYLHDRRAWFRVPAYREMVPGGFAYRRVVYMGSASVARRIWGSKAVERYAR